MKGQDTPTIGDRMLEIFRAYGAEYIFSSPGSEWAPLWEALARASTEGKGPRYLNVRHEELAVSLAAGYYRQSKKLPVVVLHTAAGTLHGAMALSTAQHDRAPMVVLAGDSAGYGEMDGPDPGYQWVRMLSSCGGSSPLAQPYVKRSSRVTCREVLPGMVQDACRLALTPPYGPVFLSVPFEFMLGSCPSFDARCAPPPLPTHASAAVLEDVARQLVQAERPVISTEYAGKDPRNVEPLVELAESLACPVVEAGQAVYLNFPRDHALHQGFDGKALFDDSDLILLVASQMPWYPPSNRPKGAKIILIDDDPAHELADYWGCSVDLVIAGEVNSSLQELARCVKRMVAESGLPRAAADERRGHWQEKHELQWKDLRAQALSGAEKQPISPRWAIHTLAEALPAGVIVTEEAVTFKGMFARYMRRCLPGTYQSRNRGSLGLGLGTALGLKLASPDRMVVLLQGDGALNYNPVLPAFGFSQQFGLPILLVLMNNQGYRAMKQAHLGYYPDGWAARTGNFFGSDIEPTPDYVAIAGAFGGHGERVEDPLALPKALERAIGRVQGGQLALVDVIVG